MKEVIGNIWDHYNQNHWIVITTNGTIKKNGEAVMGKGVALEAAKKFKDLPSMLGLRLRTGGNVVNAFYYFRLFTFPVKHNWWEKADIGLIEKSCKELVSSVNMGEMAAGLICPIFIVRPGCGNGQLDWKDVKPILEKLLDDRFIVVERKYDKVFD